MKEEVNSKVVVGRGTGRITTMVSSGDIEVGCKGFFWQPAEFSAAAGCSCSNNQPG